MRRNDWLFCFFYPLVKSGEWQTNCLRLTSGLCQQNPTQSWIFFLGRPRFCWLMITQSSRYPWSSGMNGDKSRESEAFLFSWRVPDFYDGRRSFPTNEKSNVYRRGCQCLWILLITNLLNCWAPVPLWQNWKPGTDLWLISNISSKSGMVSKK